MSDFGATVHDEQIKQAVGLPPRAAKEIAVGLGGLGALGALGTAVPALGVPMAFGAGAHVLSNAIIALRNKIPGLSHGFSWTAARGLEHGLRDRTVRAGVLSPIMHLAGPEYMASYGFGNQIGRQLRKLSPDQRVAVVNQLVNDLTYTRHMKNAPIISEVYKALKGLSPAEIRDPETTKGVLGALGMPTIRKALQGILTRPRSALLDEAGGLGLVAAGKARGVDFNPDWVRSAKNWAGGALDAEGNLSKELVESGLVPGGWMAKLSPADTSMLRQGKAYIGMTGIPMAAELAAGLVGVPLPGGAVTTALAHLGPHAILNRLLRIKFAVGEGDTVKVMADQFARGVSGRPVPGYLPFRGHGSFALNAEAQAPSRVGQAVWSGLGPGFQDVAHSFYKELQGNPDRASNVLRSLADVMTIGNAKVSPTLKRTLLLLNPKGLPDLAAAQLRDPGFADRLVNIGKAVGERVQAATPALTREVRRRARLPRGDTFPSGMEFLQSVPGAGPAVQTLGRGSDLWRQVIDGIRMRDGAFA